MFENQHVVEEQSVVDEFMLVEGEHNWQQDSAIQAEPQLTIPFPSFEQQIRQLRLAIFVLLGVLCLAVLAIGLTIRKAQYEWYWEQARGAFRDAFFRQSDYLPAAQQGTPAADVTAVSTTSLSLSDFSSNTGQKPTQLPSPSPLPTDHPTALPSPSPTPFPLKEAPGAYYLSGFRYEKQKANNCGPTTLSMMLSYWGWQGDQDTIGNVLKPTTRDKNVRWDELVTYVKTSAGWLDSMFRVNGDFALIEKFIANDYPVMIETGYYVNTLWVGHYLLVTGYDANTKTLRVHDATGGPDRDLSYDEVDELWQQFNRMFILVYPVEDQAKVAFMLGADYTDEAQNRQRALERAEQEAKADPKNPFAWFNIGSNLTYFDRYAEAITAYDKAREIGLPWRMLFYQFGPYRAYFYSGRYQDVEDLASATLEARPDLEESFVWRGWARYMLGRTNEAILDWNSALEVNPNFADAITALEYVGAR
ncbi:MAG TPA: C39 family peptidase [Anaerolineales bacterium]|nr:C39 family peptidase [Anaerolineales bacterium]